MVDPSRLADCAEANHTFSSGSVDWGFTTFLALRDIFNTQQKGFLVDDTLEVPSLPLPCHVPIGIRDADAQCCSGKQMSQ